jgi:hypothetical protein
MFFALQFLRRSRLLRTTGGRTGANAMAFPAEISLSRLDGSNGFVLAGIDAGDSSGSSVSSAGDGYDDLILGGSDSSFVVFGGPSGITGAGSNDPALLA